MSFNKRRLFETLTGYVVVTLIALLIYTIWWISSYHHIALLCVMGGIFVLFILYLSTELARNIGKDLYPCLEEWVINTIADWKHASSVRRLKKEAELKKKWDR